MERRTMIAGTLAALAASASGRVVAQPTARTIARNLVLVHGLFADGSCWSKVIARLQAAGLNATAVQNPGPASMTPSPRPGACSPAKMGRRCSPATPLLG